MLLAALNSSAEALNLQAAATASLLQLLRRRGLNAKRLAKAAAASAQHSWPLSALAIFL